MGEVSGCVLAAQLYPTLCDPMDWGPPGSSVRGILQEGILEWVAIPFSGGFPPIQGSNPGLPLCRWILYHLSHREAQLIPQLVFLESFVCDLWFVEAVNAVERSSPPFYARLRTEIILSELWTVINPDGTEESNTRGFRLCISRITWLRMYYSLGICDAMQGHAGWDFSRMRRKLLP